jgi:hypothetical protein
VYATEKASCDTAYLPNFLKVGTCFQAIIRVCLSNFRGRNVGITDGRGL